MRYVIDPAHNEFGFSVRHMGLSKVRGRFAKADGHLEVENGQLQGLQAEVEIASVDTKQPDRDNHLRSADFFDAANHPKMTYKSTEVKALGGGRYAVKGDLTIRGTTHQVPLELELTDEVAAQGKKIIGYSGTGHFNRKDYGLVWNMVLEGGGLLVGEDVSIFVEGEAIAQ